MIHAKTQHQAEGAHRFEAVSFSSDIVARKVSSERGAQKDNATKKVQLAGFNILVRRCSYEVKRVF